MNMNNNNIELGSDHEMKITDDSDSARECLLQLDVERLVLRYKVERAGLPGDHLTDQLLPN